MSVTVLATSVSTPITQKLANNEEMFDRALLALADKPVQSISKKYVIAKCRNKIIGYSSLLR
jgi:hypothetical protein